jgi:membrane-associated phospholipid phosphatase
LENPKPNKTILNKFYPEDVIAILFSSITIFLVALNISNGSIKDKSALIAPAVSLLLFSFLVFYQKSSTSKTLKFLRSYLHIPLYGIIFSAFQLFVHIMNPIDYDTLLLKADLAVFGFDITRWFEPYTGKVLTEIITLSYFSYYIFPTLTFVLLYFSKDPAAFTKARNYLLAIIIGWYGAFIFYLALPAAGPDIAFPEHYTVPIEGLSPLTNMYLENLGKYLKESFVRNTFPSMHFGIILITNYFAYSFKRKYFWFATLPVGTLLAIATVYLRQHYLIDLVGSLPVAALSIYLAGKLMKMRTN